MLLKEDKWPFLQSFVDQIKIVNLNVPGLVLKPHLDTGVLQGIVLPRPLGYTTQASHRNLIQNEAFVEL